jgi:hypothetical protein
MHDILFLLIGADAVVAFIVAVLTMATAAPEPTIIYVQTLAPRRNLGCLPLIVSGILVLIALRLLAGA